MTDAPATGRGELRAGFWFSFRPGFSWLALCYFLPVLVLLSYSVAHHEYVHIRRVTSCASSRECATLAGTREWDCGTVYQLSYLGPATEYLVQCDLGLFRVLELRRVGSARYAEGARLTLSWRREEALVYPGLK